MNKNLVIVLLFCLVAVTFAASVYDAGSNPNHPDCKLDLTVLCNADWSVALCGGRVVRECSLAMFNSLKEDPFV